VKVPDLLLDLLPLTVVVWAPFVANIVGMAMAVATPLPWTSPAPAPVVAASAEPSVPAQAVIIAMRIFMVSPPGNRAMD